MRRWAPSDASKALKVLWDDRGLTVVSSAYSAQADQSGNGVNLAEGNATQRPATGRTINGHAAPDYDGSNDIMDTTAASKHLSDVSTTTKYHFFGGFSVDAFHGNSATSYLNDGFFADAGQYCGLFLRANGGSPLAYFYTWDTTERRVPMSITTGLHAFEWWCDGTNIHANLDGVAGTPAACTGPGSRTGLLAVGSGTGATFFDGGAGLFFGYADNLPADEAVLARHYAACYLGTAL